MAAGTNQAHSCQESEERAQLRLETDRGIVLNKIKQQWGGRYLLEMFICVCV